MSPSMSATASVVPSGLKATDFAPRLPGSCRMLTESVAGLQRYVLPLPPRGMVAATASILPSGLKATESGMKPVGEKRGTAAGRGEAGVLVRLVGFGLHAASWLAGPWPDPMVETANATTPTTTASAALTIRVSRRFRRRGSLSSSTLGQLRRSGTTGGPVGTNAGSWLSPMRGIG